mmetsp:Transcript_71638/g.180928  ORF Transcript_71638/g.180928 Transcript_71638/m.180928 type:complete len:136 (-) Transcript_71638:207-614(-)
MAVLSALDVDAPRRKVSFGEVTFVQVTACKDDLSSAAFTMMGVAAVASRTIAGDEVEAPVAPAATTDVAAPIVSAHAGITDDEVAGLADYMQRFSLAAESRQQRRSVSTSCRGFLPALNVRSSGLWQRRKEVDSQ